MLYQTHAFDAKLDHNGCVWYIRLIFNGYCFVGDAVFCQCRTCRFSLCAGSKDDVSGVPFSFPHIAFVELFLISYFYYFEAFLDKVVFSPSSDMAERHYSAAVYRYSRSRGLPVVFSFDKFDSAVYF